MGNIVSRNNPCIACSSSDAMQIYEDGGARCYSCGRNFKKKEVEEGVMERKPAPSLTTRMFTLDEINVMRSKGNEERGISTLVTEFFGVKTAFKSDGKTQIARIYPYEGGYNVRMLPKKFYWVGGKREGLFGQDKFTPNARVDLVITTGEEDAMAVAEASMAQNNRIYPVVSAGSDNNMHLLVEAREWIRGFRSVVLMFDQDGPGKKALEEAIRIVGIDKVKIATLPEKDPNAVLLSEGGPKALISAFFDAQPYTPGGFLTGDELWDKVVEHDNIKSVPFPPCMDGVNKKTRGKRPGDITLLISGTGSGKSTLLREDALYTLENHLVDNDDKIGWIALEEGPAESARKFAGMVLKKNPAAQEEPMTLEELKPGFDHVFGQNKMIVLDHQGSMSDAGLIEKMEWLCLKGCRWIYLDHITIAASEGFNNAEGNEAVDKLMNALLKLVKRYPVWIGVVSHLRKTSTGSLSFEQGKLPSLDDIKGSGSIKQISMDVIAFARNSRAKSDVIRNKIIMEVLKCRYTGLTGPVIGAEYNFETGRVTQDDTFLTEKDLKDDDD